MSKHDEARRTFLIGAAVGAVAGAGLVPDAVAQDGKAASAAAPSRPVSNSPGAGAFFNPEDASTIAAFTERLMPGAPGMPGARDADVLNYIDLALAGAYADQQDFYRSGLASLDAYCRKTHNQAFARLDAARQDEVIKALEDNKAAGFTWPTAPLSSTRFALTPWRACFPTLSMAATRTSPVGSWFNSPARNRSLRRRRCAARRHSPVVQS